ncbi:MAG: helix-turn-helix domain-containing protein, partial [Candidatus Nitrosocaldus sp.]
MEKMISEKARKAMEGIGLTSYEIKAYTTLLAEGALTAQELSIRSGVPYSKIYEVLGKLEEKGWIESDGSRPTKFYPRSPATALEVMKARMESEMRDAESTIVGELMPLYDKSGAKEKPEIWVLRGLHNILAKVREVILGCEKELLVALPAVAEGVTKQMQPALRQLREKGVRIAILASESSSSEVIKALSRVAEVRLKDSMFGGGVISDGKQVILLLASERMGNEPLAILAEHTGLAGFAREYFNYLWKEAK